MSDIPSLITKLVQSEPIDTAPGDDISAFIEQMCAAHERCARQCAEDYFLSCHSSAPFVQETLKEEALDGIEQGVRAVMARYTEQVAEREAAVWEHMIVPTAVKFAHLAFELRLIELDRAAPRIGGAA